MLLHPGIQFCLTPTSRNFERSKKTALKVILPEFSYKEVPIALILPTINVFLLNLADGHFSKILWDSSNPLHDRIIIFNNVRTSSRSSDTFRPKLCRTEKKLHSFLITLWNIATTSLYTGNNVLVFQNIFKQPCRVFPCYPVLLSHNIVLDRGVL